MLHDRDRIIHRGGEAQPAVIRRRAPQRRGRFSADPNRHPTSRQGAQQYCVELEELTIVAYCFASPEPAANRQNFVQAAAARREVYARSVIFFLQPTRRYAAYDAAGCVGRCGGDRAGDGERIAQSRQVDVGRQPQFPRLRAQQRQRDPGIGPWRVDRPEDVTGFGIGIGRLDRRWHDQMIGIGDAVKSAAFRVLRQRDRLIKLRHRHHRQPETHGLPLLTSIWLACS